MKQFLLNMQLNTKSIAGTCSRFQKWQEKQKNYCVKEWFTRHQKQLTGFNKVTLIKTLIFFTVTMGACDTKSLLRSNEKSITRTKDPAFVFPRVFRTHWP